MWVLDEFVKYSTLYSNFYTVQLRVSKRGLGEGGVRTSLNETRADSIEGLQCNGSAQIRADTGQIRFIFGADKGQAKSPIWVGCVCVLASG